jgi:uncharacterized membrane protein YeiB
MLLLIAMANVSWFLWGHPGSFNSAHPTDGTTVDRVLRAFMGIAVDGRILPLFAFLFGYGMVQFARGRTARGVPPGDIKRMLRRRHLAMILLGFLHALLLFGGDILGAYGVLGLILMLAFEAKNKTLRIFFWLLIGYAVVSGVGGMVTMWQLESSGFDVTGAEAGFEFALADLFAGISNYGIAMAVRVGMWLVTSPMLIFTGVIPAAIIVGWLAARHGVLEQPERWRPLLTKVAIGGITLGWLSGIPVASAHLGHSLMPESLMMGYLTLNYVGGTAAGLGYAAVIALFTIRFRPTDPAAATARTPGPVVRSLAAVGKRSLTFYLFQALIFAPLLAAWGFGLGERINTTGALLISLGVWLLSILIATILEARGLRGPMEVVLRRLTYLPESRLTPPGPPPPHGPHRLPPSPQHPEESRS